MLSSIQRLVLDNLGVQSIAAVIGGSMGGMHTLEWPLCTPPGYIKNIIPIATSAYQGAWGISWGETQRQAICSDVAFRAGWYTPTPEGQPRHGMGLARMIGMLTYRSSASFEARFGRRCAAPREQTAVVDGLPTPPLSETGSATSSTEEPQDTTLQSQFSAQSYLQYHADKFLDRFDANCYLHLLKKMNRHDVTRDRIPGCDAQSTPSLETLKRSLKTVPGGALVIGVQTDLLFPLQQQDSIAQCLQGATLEILESPDGHDGFLLEFEQLDMMVKGHLRRVCPQFYKGPARSSETEEHVPVAKSVFGEVESVEL
jgi:homoserine O-acetyltransferase